MVKKVITNFDSSKVSGPDFIAVMVLNSEPEFSYILGELFNMCLKESSSEVLFWTWKIVGRSHRLALYLRILGEGVQLKTTALLVVFLWLVKLVSNRIVDHLEKCCLFSDFQYSMVLGLVNQLQIFWQLYLIELLDLLVKRFGTTQAVALDMSKAFSRVWHAGLHHKLSLTEFQVRYLALFLLFSEIDSFKWFWMISLHKDI